MGTQLHAPTHIPKRWITQRPTQCSLSAGDPFCSPLADLPENWPETMAMKWGSICIQNGWVRPR
jgi:hypothetical protein